MDFCKFSDILGKPGKGLHSYRLFDIAIVDVILTIILAYLISKYFKYSFYIVLIILFLLSIFLHRLFCVKTTVNNLIFSYLYI